jgi:hypothetical protein
MISPAQAVLDAADAWADAMERETIAEELNQVDEDAINARSSAEVDLIAAIQRWRQAEAS